MYTVSQCSIEVVDAGWIDPHAPHVLDGPSGHDKRVYDVYARIVQ